jgi:regulator of protease activity HflC (stomatin/prohibitin superfamily)
MCNFNFSKWELFVVFRIFIVLLQAWVIERMGKFHRLLEPGLNFLIPIIDRIKYVNSLKEIAIDIPKQSAITKGIIHVFVGG